MSKLSARHIGELVAELRPLLVGRTVLDVQALPPRDLLLVFASKERDERVLRLCLSVDPDAARVHLQSGRVQRYGGPPGPFYQRLATELGNARCLAFEQVAGDRIVRLDFAARLPLALMVELVGRHGNLVLLDGDGRVRDLLVEPPQRAGVIPRLVRGEPWRPAPGRPPADAGPALEELLPRPSDPASIAPLSQRVEIALGGLARELEQERARKGLRDRLERQRQGCESLLRGLVRRRASVQEAERIRMDGELLKSELGRIRRGEREVTVADWFGNGEPRRIVLDPKLSAHENLEHLFARYHKLVRAREAVDREEELARARLELLGALSERVAHEDAQELEREAIDAGLLAPRQRKTHRDPAATSARLPYRRYVGLHGGEIRVGRSARDNDALCSRHSRGNDLWLHTADAPGSHVVLRLEKDRDPDPEEVLDAAHLAIHFSPLRGARRAEVHVARRKEVHKPRGAPPGLVTLSGGKTKSIAVEPARLARLLAGEGRGGGSPA